MRVIANTMSLRTHYDVLRITPRASHEEVKRAFRSLAKRYHPDKSPDPKNAIRFKAILKSYKTLGDTYKRRVYDRSINVSPFNPIQSVSSDPFGARNRYGSNKVHAKVRAGGSADRNYTMGVIGIYVVLLLFTVIVVF